MKKIKIAFVLTAFFVVIWLITILVFIALHPHRQHPNEVPIPLLYPIYVIFSFWFIVGIVALIKNFKTLWNEIIKFINEKN